MPLPVHATTDKPSSSSTPETATSTGQTGVQGAIASATDATGAAAKSGSTAAEHTKSEAEQAADKLYEERMEDEYAKREGGA